MFSVNKLTGDRDIDAKAEADAVAAYDAFAQTRVGYCIDLLNELFEVTFLPALLGTFTPVAIRTWQDMAQNKYAFGSISNVHLYVLSVGVGLWFDTLRVAYDCLFGQEESEESE